MAWYLRRKQAHLGRYETADFPGAVRRIERRTGRPRYYPVGKRGCVLEQSGLQPRAPGWPQ